MRFRASLMAMRRISWIDQRIRDGVVVFSYFPGGGGRFIWHWRIGAKRRPRTLRSDSSWSYPPPRHASNRSCAARRRAAQPGTDLHSSQHVLREQRTYRFLITRSDAAPTTEPSPQSTLSASTIFESWLPMDSETFRKSNCYARPECELGIIPRTQM